MHKVGFIPKSAHNCKWNQVAPHDVFVLSELTNNISTVWGKTWTIATGYWCGRGHGNELGDRRD